MSLRTHWQRVTLNVRILWYLRCLLREARLSAPQIARLQYTRLKGLLIHAYEKVEFYRDRFDGAGFDPHRFCDVEQLKTLPVLTKADYRKLTEVVYSANPSACERLYKDGTSGSTGTPLRIYRSWDERAYMVAKWMRALYLSGYRWNDAVFSLPSPLRLQRDSLIQRLGILKRHSVAYSEPVETMVAEYLKSPPSVVYGNKSHLVEMARYCATHGVRLPPPRFCVCAAETLDAGSRDMIVRTFGPNLAGVYGAVEFNTLAWKTGDSQLFEFSHTTDVLELAGGDTDDENCGYGIITDLFIRSFPLIRYQLGDYLETCVVDGVRRLRRIAGRLDDWVVFRDGTRKPFHPFFNVMKQLPQVMQFRVIQESVGLIRILVVKEGPAVASELEGAILRGLRKEVRDGDVEYKVEWIDEIRPEANGKIRMLISNVRSTIR